LSRSRISNAPSEEDRQIGELLLKARNAVEAAVQVTRQSKTAGYRQRRTERDLGRALEALNNVGTIAPRYGANDPDLVSEDDRIRAFRERQEQKRLAAVAAVAAIAAESSTTNEVEP